MAETVVDEMKRTRLDFAPDSTPLNSLFGREPITIAQMHARLWSHIEDNRLVVNGHSSNGREHVHVTDMK